MKTIIKSSLRAIVFVLALGLVSVTLVSKSSAVVGPPVPVCDLSGN